MFNIVEALFTPLWNFLIGQFYEMLFEVVTQVLTWIISSTGEFWTHGVIVGAINTAKWGCWGLIFATMIVVFYDVLEDYSSGKPVFIGVVVSNLAKAMGFAAIAPILPEYAIKMTDKIVASLNLSSGIAKLRGYSIANLSGYTQGEAFMFLVTLVIILIACIAFLVMVLQRFGIMFIQAMSCPLYVPSILRGDTTALSQWLRQTIAVVMTFFMQYTLFYLGLRFWAENSLLLCFGAWIVMGKVAKTLDKYGFSTGAGSSMSAATSTLAQGASILAK